jgi:hypothetical protein
MLRKGRWCRLSIGDMCKRDFVCLKKKENDFILFAFSVKIKMSEVTLIVSL